MPPEPPEIYKWTTQEESYSIEIEKIDFEIYTWGPVSVTRSAKILNQVAVSFSRYKGEKNWKLQ